MEYRVYVPAIYTNEVIRALAHDPALSTVELLRELRYYFNKQDDAGYPAPIGYFEVQFDEQFIVCLANNKRTIRVLGAMRV
jgi:hypothetical protein